MLSAFLQGIIPGLILSIAIGPVFFLLIQTSLQRGFKMSLFMESGIILSDATCILIAYFGLAAFLHEPANKSFVYYTGGLVLIVFGIFTFLSHKKVQFQDAEEIKKGDKTKLFIKGYFFNISNPSVVFFWAAFIGLTIPEFKGRKPEIIIYVFSTLFTVFSIDLLKSYGAFRIKKFMTEKSLSVMNKIAGVSIGGFGLFLILKQYTGT